MYCKQCGHRWEEKTETCAKCGVKTTSEAHLVSAPSKPKIRWRVPVVAAVTALVACAVIPRIFLRSEMDAMGPTDKLRFLHALDRSEYKRVGQREFRVEGQTLIVIWDLRWGVLPETKQMEIVRIVGKAWHVVGGEDTRFRVEGADALVAEYKDGEPFVGAAQEPADPK